MKSAAIVAAALTGAVFADDWDPKKTTTTTTTASAAWAEWTTTTTTTAPYDPWSDWTTGVDPGADWGKIKGVTTIATTTVCPPYTATTPPAWFSELPASVVSAIEAEFTGAPSDWCKYTPVAPAATTTYSGWWYPGVTTVATTTVCPPYTATTYPAWFSELPASVVSAIEAKFTGAPSDWCKYTPVAPTTTATVTGWWYPGVTTVATTTVCPSYTATTYPSWFSELPASLVSSIEAEFTGAPSDWCLYTPVAAVTATSCVTTTTMGWAAPTTTVYVTVTSTWGAAPASSWVDPSWDPNTCSLSVLTSTGAPTWVPDPNWTSYSTVYVTPVAPVASSTWADWTEDPTTSSTWAEWTADPTTSSTWAEWTDPATSSSWAWPATSASPAAPSYTGSWAPPAGVSGGFAPIAPNANQWAMTYSPYTASSGCKDQGTISADIASIASKGFTSVRVYSTDCKTLEFVGQACKDNGLKIILGIFISDTGINGAYQQVTDILAWAQWDIVELIVVGNEAVFNGYCSAGDLAWFIESVKSQASGAGYNGPVTTTEPLSTWQSVGTTFCAAVDVVAANLYAFFNAATTCDGAGAFIQSEIAILEGICSGKNVYVMETGWPNAGNCNGAACPGPQEQATAIKGIQSVVGAEVVFFSFEDDAWKQPGPYDVEQHWGCADVFGAGAAPAASSPAWGAPSTTAAAADPTGW